MPEHIPRPPYVATRENPWFEEIQRHEGEVGCSGVLPAAPCWCVSWGGSMPLNGQDQHESSLYYSPSSTLFAKHEGSCCLLQ